MKPCRFCLENIHESAEACAHCGNWQPSPEEITSAYRAVIRRKAWNGNPWIAPCILLFVLVILSSVYFKSTISAEEKSQIALIQIVLFFLTFVLFFVRCNMFQQLLDLTAFHHVVTLDHPLHQELKQRQMRKASSYNKTLVVMVCILILLLIFTNAKIFGIL